MIEVKHLSKFYGKHQAVDDVSFSAPKGKIIGLLGPNGAGKSSIMNMITGYISASSGEIKIGEYDVFGEPLKAKRLIGYLPEIPPLYEDMTVDEYLFFVAELKKIKPKKERVSRIEDVCEKVRIQDVRNRLIKNLSKGYKQRVGFAQALLGNPAVLILDEPTVGLDPKQIIEIRELIRELSKEHTIIFSSHILSEVNELCDDILIINQGKLIAQGDTKTLSEQNDIQKQIFLVVRGEEKQIQQVLDNTDAIERYSIEKIDGDQKKCEVAVMPKEGKDIRESLFFAFANARLPIIQMNMNGNSLEDVFIELTEADHEDNGDSLAQTDSSKGKADEAAGADNGKAENPANTDSEKAQKEKEES